MSFAESAGTSAGALSAPSRGASSGVSQVGRLSAGAARRIALAAQGFGTPRPTGTITARQISRVVDTMGLLQLDSVNVLERSHYLPVLSRLGPYPRATLDRLTGHGPGRVERRYVEYWAHEASLVPLSTHALLRWRMAEGTEAWGSIRRIGQERPEFVQEILDLVRDQGPIRSKATGVARPAREPGQMWQWHDGKADLSVHATSTPRSGFWEWTDTKTALEYLFYEGKITTAKRVNFQRYYDLTERVIPAEVLAMPTPDPADAQRELVRISARALGVAVEPDLRDYFRLSPGSSKRAVAELTAAGELIPVEVDGWRLPAYLWHEARRPRRVDARALLSPFDSLIWYRERTERLFGFRYRIEIYTPQPKRVFGYYVLPFLLGDSLVARVDLKSDRQRGVLLVQSAWLEEGKDGAHVAGELAEELTSIATWLGLGSVAVAPTGNLAHQLARIL